MKSQRDRCRRPAGTQKTASAAAVAAMCAGLAANVAAMEIDVGNPDVKLRFDNTVSYSAAERLKNPSDGLAGATAVAPGVFAPNNANGDDGDNNFRRGLISNRLDLFSELDISYRQFGFRASAAAWYDAVYQRGNDNDNAFRTVNSVSVPANRFTAATQDIHGHRGEVLDAFVFGKLQLGGLPTTFRAGRHSLQWGESLFIGGNAIAGTMQPVDVVKLLSAPGSQFKEIIRPVNQLSGQIQLSEAVSLAAFYQLQWARNRLPAVGSFFSTDDYIGNGAERINTGAPVFAPNPPFSTSVPFFPGFNKIPDREAKNSGQGGMQLRFRLPGGQTDYGLYAVRYHSKGPILLTYGNPASDNSMTGGPGSFNSVFHEGVRAFGASFSTTFGDLNLAGEASVRRNLDLVTKVTPADQPGDYAVGNSAHAQVSWLYSLTPNFLFKDSLWLGEIAWNRLTGITRNAKNLDPNTTRQAFALRTVFAPKFAQALPGWDLEVPVGLGYNLHGRSSVVTSFNGIAGEHAGDLSLGLKGTYLAQWRLAANYTHYIGREAPNVNGTGSAYNFGQPLKDRDFVSLTASTTF
ncbi:MAG: DUF1302 domain-containing protein [Caldimonas sp.]